MASIASNPSTQERPSGVEAGNPFHPDFPGLLRGHVRMLREESGIAAEVIRERRYYSALGKKELRDLGFAPNQCRPPGLVLPLHATDGSIPTSVYRPDFPRKNTKGDEIKYEMPTGSGVRLDCPPRCRVMLGDPKVPIIFTEGTKKADSIASHGGCVVALQGVFGFKGKNVSGGVTLLADFDSVTLSDRLAVVIFDSDVMVKPAVRSALDRLTEHLNRKGANVRHVYLPSGPNGEKVGVDDFLLTHSIEDLERLAVPPPVPLPSTPTIEISIEGHRLNDVGNAERFAAQHGRYVRFCHRWGKWLRWDRRRWRIDDRGQVVAWAKETVRTIYGEARHAKDLGERQRIVAHALKSESAARIAAMLSLAESEPGIPITPDELDRDSWLLNVQNGVLDLRTGQLRPHDPANLITKLAPVDYDVAAACPVWDAFLERVLPDPDLRAYVRRKAGYSTTGDVSEQCLSYCHGGGANGKTTLLNAIHDTLGDYAAQAAPDLLVVKRGETHPTELADLFGIRFLATTEVDEGRRLAEALVKQLTGGDPIKARRMHEDFWSFLPTHKIWLAANHRLVVRGTDHAIWRRIHEIPFTVEIPERERDRKLSLKLRAERAGILRWLVEGCLEWQRDGLGVPDAVDRATAQYRTEMDVFAAFIADCCVVNADATVTKGALYVAYTRWAEATNEYVETQRAISARLTERGYLEDRGKAGVRLWVGIGLVAPPDSGPPNPTSDASDVGDAKVSINALRYENKLFIPDSASPCVTSVTPGLNGHAPAVVAEPHCPRCGTPGIRLGSFIADDGKGRFECPKCDVIFWASLDSIGTLIEGAR